MKTVLFVCGHNAGRSQMAEAFFTKRARERKIDARARSAGTTPSKEINPLAMAAMEEIGFSMVGRTPRRLTQDLVDEADRIVTMGCGVEAESCPARFLATEDWGLDDPAGQPIERVREIRDQIATRVEMLLTEIEREERGERG